MKNLKTRVLVVGLALLMVTSVLIIGVFNRSNNETVLNLSTKSATNTSLVLQLSSNDKLQDINASDIKGLADGLKVVSIKKTDDDKTAIIKLESVKGCVGNYFITALDSNAVHYTVNSEHVSKDPIVFEE